MYIRMIKSDIIPVYKELLIEIINTFESERVMGRKNKFPINFYLDPIIDILFEGCTWNYVKHNSKINISTIKKKFKSWQNNGIFIIAHKLLLNKYCNIMSIDELLIDSSCIQNNNCSDELLGYYYKIKCKKQIKLSILCTPNNSVLAHHLSNPKEHDSQHIPILIDKLKSSNININNNCKIIGDKGYIANKTHYKVNKKNVNIITPKRKNQKSKHYSKNINCLKRRYIVEQTIAHLKKTYRRLALIYERNISTYESFLVMAFTCQIIRKVNDLNKYN
jgi:transposase